MQLDRMISLELYLKEHKKFAAAQAILQRFQYISQRDLPIVQDAVEQLLHNIFDIQTHSTPNTPKGNTSSVEFSPLIVSQQSQEWSNLQKLSHFLAHRGYAQFLCSSLKSARHPFLLQRFSSYDFLSLSNVIPPSPPFLYKPSTHPSFVLLPQVFELFQAEVGIVLALVSRDEAVKYCNDLFSEFFTILVEHFQLINHYFRAENLRNIGWRVTNRLLLIVDLHYLMIEMNSTFDSFNSNTNNKLRPQISEMLNLVKSSSSSWLHSFFHDLVTFLPVKPQWLVEKRPEVDFNSLPQDGGISWVTIEVLEVLIGLIPYRMTVLPLISNQKMVTIVKYLTIF
ncbi:hypothetical protein GEMRC1_011148 [Eukaryota sp. GEM-RC1]